MKAARMPKLPNQAKAKAKPEANAKQAAGVAATAAMGPIKAPCCTRDMEKERPDPTSLPVKLDLQQENNNRPSSTADDIHKACPSPSLEVSQPYRSHNSRTSKAERVLGLTPQDLEREKRLGRSNRQTPTISIDSPRTPIFSRHPPAAAQSSDPHQRCHSQKSASKSCCGVLHLPAERQGVTHVASSSDLKLVGDGSEVESDADQSSVGDEGSARSSPYPKKKSTENRGRDRFKKILRPLTRSKSAGAGDRAPAYALFLRHQPHPEPSVVNRSTDNVMRNSTDYTESEDETTDGATGHKVPTTYKDKKDRFAFFRRSAEGHSTNALLPSTETLQGWMKAFDKLLADSYGLKLFREFLRREFSDENIEFWVECEKYRHLTSEKHRSTEAKRIFREYVAVQAPNEINLDSKTREVTESNLSHADTKVFEAAQKRIEALMEKDSYPRFLQSDLFQRLLQQRQAADNSLKIT